MQTNTNRAHRLRALAAALLLLLLPLSAACAAPELENGVTWDTTAQQAVAAECGPWADMPETYQTGDFLQYGFYHDTGDDTAGYQYYVYRGDRLALYGRNTAEAYLPAGLVAGDVYAARLAAFTARYGQPATEDAQQFLTAINALEDGALGIADVDACSGWDLGEGTALYLARVRASAVLYVYVNEALLFGQGV